MRIWTLVVTAVLITLTVGVGFELFGYYLEREARLEFEHDLGELEGAVNYLAASDSGTQTVGLRVPAGVQVSFSGRYICYDGENREVEIEVVGPVLGEGNHRLLVAREDQKVRVSKLK